MSDLTLVSLCSSSRKRSRTVQGVSVDKAAAGPTFNCELFLTRAQGANHDPRAVHATAADPMERTVGSGG